MRKWLVRVLLSATGLVALIAMGGSVFLRTPGFCSVPSGARLARIETSPQCRDGQFRNWQPQWLDLGAALEEATFGEANPNADPTEPVAYARTDPATLATAPALGLRITWFGHSSSPVEINGVRVVTDPSWGSRVWPVDFIGPKPWVTPPIALQELPPIDAVVISHDHFDRLDRSTIEAMLLWKNTFVVPLGIGAHLERWGIPPARIRELDWWDSTDINGLWITATAARHASERRSHDSNLTLWAGYAFVGTEHRVEFSGDASFHDDLRAIGERMGPFDVSLTDSGQCNAYWTDACFGTELAVQAYRPVRGKRMSPVHWALLNLAPYTWTEPD